MNKRCLVLGNLNFYSSKVPAGFPSPAADHIEKHISLDELFDIRAPHVYLVRIDGDSMQGAGIYSGDLVVVDRSIDAVSGDIVIAALNSEPFCKRLLLRENAVMLLSENSKYPARHVMEGDESPGLDQVGKLWTNSGATQKAPKLHLDSPQGDVALPCLELGVLGLGAEKYIGFGLRGAPTGTDSIS